MQFLFISLSAAANDAFLMLHFWRWGFIMNCYLLSPLTSFGNEKRVTYTTRVDFKIFFMYAHSCAFFKIIQYT